MKIPFLFTYIIPFTHSHERITNLKRTIEWLSGFSNVEIIVVEQSKSPMLHTFSMRGFKHIFTQTDIPFNIGWAYNIGIKNSTSDVIVFGDWKTKMNPDDMIRSLNQLQNNQVVICNSKTVTLHPHEFDNDFQKLGMLNRNNDKSHISQAIVAMRKDALERLSLWPEDFFEGDHVYQLQDIKIKQLTSYQEMPFTAFRYIESEMNISQINESRNNMLIENYKKMDNSNFERSIASTRSKIGLKMRFTA